eukprot:gene3230-biopygen649
MGTSATNITVVRRGAGWGGTTRQTRASERLCEGIGTLNRIRPSPAEVPHWPAPILDAAGLLQTTDDRVRAHRPPGSNRSAGGPTPRKWARAYRPPPGQTGTWRTPPPLANGQGHTAPPGQTGTRGTPPPPTNEHDNLANGLGLPLEHARELAKAGWVTSWMTKAKEACKVPASSDKALYPPEGTMSSDITVAEYGRNAFGATVEPSGPVALLRDSRGELTLLPAEFCVSRARTPEKPRATSAHGHGTESFSAEHQQQPATDRTVSEVAQMVQHF